MVKVQAQLFGTLELSGEMMQPIFLYLKKVKKILMNFYLKHNNFVLKLISILPGEFITVIG